VPLEYSRLSGPDINRHCHGGVIKPGATYSPADSIRHVPHTVGIEPWAPAVLDAGQSPQQARPSGICAEWGWNLGGIVAELRGRSAYMGFIKPQARRQAGERLGGVGWRWGFPLLSLPNPFVHRILYS